MQIKKVINGIIALLLVAAILLLSDLSNHKIPLRKTPHGSDTETNTNYPSL